MTQTYPIILVFSILQIFMLFSFFIRCNWKANMQLGREICNVIQVTLVGGAMSPPKLSLRSGSLIRIEPLKAKVRLKVIVLLLHHVVDVGKLSISKFLPFLRLSYVFREVVLDLPRLHIKGIHSLCDFTQVPTRGTRTPFTWRWRHTTWSGGLVVPPVDVMRRMPLVLTSAYPGWDSDARASSLGPSGGIPSWCPTCLIHLHGCWGWWTFLFVPYHVARLPICSTCTRFLYGLQENG